MSKSKQIKLVVIGDGGVGKTCLLQVYKEGKFPTEYVPTIFDNYSCKLNVDGIDVELSLHDTAGQEEYQGLRTLAYMGAQVVAACFSLVDRNTFDNLRTKWIPELRKTAKKAQIILVGTKLDLKRSEKYVKELKKNGLSTVSMEDAEDMCKELKLRGYVQCSAKKNEGVKKVFNECISIGLSPKGKCIVM